MQMCADTITATRLKPTNLYRVGSKVPIARGACIADPTEPADDKVSVAFRGIGLLGKPDHHSNSECGSLKKTMFNRRTRIGLADAIHIS